ncbi:MAG: ATP-binding cassette domain-containing protein [Myxococcales bacterium]|nr:ATP-binding cassette domain-containing protein [Myxococcales bacterium]
MIEVQALAKRFGEVHAVRDVGFLAPDGQVTGLLGPNGAGKTTAMRMISGLLRPDVGSVTIEGVDVHADPFAARRLIGVLPDARGLYPRLTAREHLVYFGRLHSVDPNVMGERIARICNSLDMKGIIDRRVAGFSQGERMKVALARALIHDPPCILLDEPTNGLDVMSTRAVREMVRGLRSEGRCVIFSSHIMQEVAALCDRIVVIVGGRVIQMGSADELMAVTETASLEDAFVACILADQAMAGAA